MRIHSNVLTYQDVYDAARHAKAHLDTASQHGSRSRSHAFEVKLRGLSRRRPNFYNGDGQYAATWDQWGVFFGLLFEADPDMLIDGKEDLDAFGYRTGWRFDNPTEFEHPLDHDHRFRYAGTPREQECKCGAVQRW